MRADATARASSTTRSTACRSGAGHLARRDRREPLPRVLRLVAVRAQARDALEVGREHDDVSPGRRAPAICAFSTRSPWIGFLPAGASRSCTATNGTRAAWQMRTKSGMFGLPPHSTIEIPSRSASWPSARKTNGSVIFSVRPSTSSAARARNSSLRSASSSLSARKLAAAGSGSGWTIVVPSVRAPVDERELVEPPDVEERGRVRRVEHLVPGLGERPQQPVEVALRLRRQEELRLLDQQHEAALAALAEALRPPRRARPQAPPTTTPSRRPGTAVPAGSATRPPERSDAGRNTTGSAGPRRAAGPGGLVSSTISSPSASVALSRIAVAVRRGQVARRGSGVLVVQQHPDRREHVRLADARPADERAHRPGREADRARRAEAPDPHVAHSEPGPFHARSLCAPARPGGARRTARAPPPARYVRRRDRYANAVVRPSSAKPSTKTQIGATETVSVRGSEAAAT